MKELEGCGSHRDIKCFFEGYLREKKRTEGHSLPRKKDGNAHFLACLFNIVFFTFKCSEDLDFNNAMRIILSVILRTFYTGND